MVVRAFDFDGAQSDRESCTEVSSPGVDSRGTAFGDIVSGGEIFIDFEPGPARERVINLLAHEALHGMSLGHDPDEDGLMATTITGDDPFFDEFILESLRGVGVELVDDLPSRISSGERVYVNELLETYLGVRIL